MSAQPRPKTVSALAERNRKILRASVAGGSARQIGERFNLSERQVRRAIEDARRYAFSLRARERVLWFVPDAGCDLASRKSLAISLRLRFACAKVSS